jgi:5-methylcytosine-specific restriction endonuclease McrA
MANACWDEPIPMEVDCDNELPIDKPPAPKRSYRKRNIPKRVKVSVWNHYIGKEVGSAKCMCCQECEIIQGHFEAGHVISERNGGATNVANLRPVCSLCNKSMGSKNMQEFMREYGYRKPRNWNRKIHSPRKKDVIVIE